MNEEMLDCAHCPYNMQIFNIHKQAQLTKNNGLDSSIVYRKEWSWTSGQYGGEGLNLEKYQLSLHNPVSSIYIWSEIFGSPSEAKYGSQWRP